MHNAAITVKVIEYKHCINHKSASLVKLIVFDSATNDYVINVLETFMVYLDL